MIEMIFFTHCSLNLHCIVSLIKCMHIVYEGNLTSDLNTFNFLDVISTRLQYEQSLCFHIAEDFHMHPQYCSACSAIPQCQGLLIV